MKQEKNEELKRKSRLMIGLFSFLGIAMIASIAITSFTGKGTYSACTPGDVKICDGTLESPRCQNYVKNGYECVQTATNQYQCTCPGAASPEPTPTEKTDPEGTPTPPVTTPPVDCSSFNENNTLCLQYGCHYYDDGCHSTPKASPDSTPTGTTTCKSGEYLSLDGSCKTCPEGYYCIGGTSGVHLCDIGKYCPNTGMSAGIICPANHYCGSGAKIAKQCPDGKTSPIGSGSESDCVASTDCQTKTQCEAANPAYSSCIDTDGDGCYTKSNAACYKCTKGSDAYYTYTNEAGCPLAESYSKCASDTQGKNRLYLMEHNTSTGATSVVNVLECAQDANEECKVSPGGTWYHEKTCDRLVSPTTNVTINGDTTWWRCVGGGTIPTDPPGDPTDPTNPPSGETKTCYVCVSGEKSQYVWASSSANAAQAATTLSGITAKNCATTSESNCKGLPVTNCYECNGSKKYVMAESDADAKTKSGGTSCNIVTTDKCNEITPPKTGTFGIIVAWIVGMMTIGYAMWYYKKSSSLS